MGTPSYIAPEVWEADAAGPAGDIYALGCIAFEMLIGQPLFPGNTPMQVMRAHDKGPQFPARWPEGVPEGITNVLRKALAREPEARYPGAGAFWYGLNDLAAATQAAQQDAERAALAAQWKAETETAMAAGEWSAARMAVGRWLAVVPDDPGAKGAQAEIERHLAQPKAVPVAPSGVPGWVWGALGAIILVATSLAVVVLLRTKPRVETAHLATGGATSTFTPQGTATASALAEAAGQVEPAATLRPTLTPTRTPTPTFTMHMPPRIHSTCISR